jgi:hypothetical protein
MSLVARNPKKSLNLRGGPRGINQGLVLSMGGSNALPFAVGQLARAYNS